jgi:hypothetical protein
MLHATAAREGEEQKEREREREGRKDRHKIEYIYTAVAQM